MNAELLSPVCAPATATCTPRNGGMWMETLSHLDPKFGGLTAVVPALASALEERQLATVSVSAFCGPDEATPASGNAGVVTTVWPAGRARWLLDAGAKKRFAQTLLPMDGVHIHGLWDAGTHVVASAARKQKLPFVVSAHGMLEPWALAQGAMKKRIYGALVERPVLQAARWLHALTAAEADDYRRFGCTGPIAIIPNAVQPPETDEVSALENHYPQVAGKRVVLFLGRLHVKKGVELLLEAWSHVYAEFPDALLLIAGPGEAAYVRSLQQRAADLLLRDSVLFAGMLDRPAKWSALCGAQVFVLPSYSEGLSVAALESLSVGTPAIVTEACHLPEVADEGCGWQVPTSAASLAQALRASLDLTTNEQLALRHKARALAAMRFSWDTVCAQMAELYTCVLGGGLPQGFDYREAIR